MRPAKQIPTGSPLNLITVEEYLKFEEDAEIRHEYVVVQIYAMAGASEAHNLIVTNLIAILHPHLLKSITTPIFDPS